MSLSTLHRNIAAIFLVTLIAGCATAPTPKDFTDFRQHNPRSILVVPALNNTQSVEAAEFFVSTVSRPFAERGYYVFPAHMVRRVMADDGLDDASMVHAADARRFKQIFGCDSVLFIAIERWDSKYVVLSTTTTVSFVYTLKSCETGETLWVDNTEMAYSPQAGGSGNILADLITQVVVSAIEKGKPNYIPLTQQANLIASTLAGQGLPAGPYRHAEYLQDLDTFPAIPQSAEIAPGSAEIAPQSAETAPPETVVSPPEED